MFEENITIKAFRAPENPIACEQYINEHNSILEDYGIKHVTTNNNSWKSDPNVIVIAIYEEKLGLVGGARIHCKYSAKGVLPIQNALSKKEPKIDGFVDGLAGDGVGELCALWNANRFAGRELTYLLAITGFSLMQQLKLKHFIGFAAKYTLRYARSVGFLINKSMGDDGVFEYPKRGFCGIVIQCDIASQLQNSHPRWKQRTISLRANPDQLYEEQTRNAQLHAQYNLTLKHNNIDSDQTWELGKKLCFLDS